MLTACYAYSCAQYSFFPPVHIGTAFDTSLH